MSNKQQWQHWQTFFRLRFGLFEIKPTDKPGLFSPSFAGHSKGVQGPPRLRKRIWVQAGKCVTSAATIMLWKIQLVSHHSQSCLGWIVPWLSEGKKTGTAEGTSFGILGFLHHISRDAQGPPCPSAALQLLTGCVLGAVSASLFCYGLKSSSTNKITKPGCIRLFPSCPDPTLNHNVWLSGQGWEGRGDGRALCHTEGQIIRDSLSYTVHGGAVLAKDILK